MKRGESGWVAHWATHSAAEHNDPTIGPRAEALDRLIKKEIKQLEKDFLSRFQDSKTQEDYFRVWWEVGTRLAWMSKVKLAHPDDFEYLEQACYDNMGAAFAKFMGFVGWQSSHYLERALRLGSLPWETARCFGVWDTYRKLSVHRLFLKETRVLAWLQDRTNKSGKWIFSDCAGYQAYAYRNFMGFITTYFRHKDSIAFSDKDLYSLFDRWVLEAKKAGAVEIYADGNIRPPRNRKAEKELRLAKNAQKPEVKVETYEASIQK